MGSLIMEHTCFHRMSHKAWLLKNPAIETHAGEGGTLSICTCPPSPSFVLGNSTKTNVETWKQQNESCHAHYTKEVMGICAITRCSEGCFAWALTWGYFTVASTIQSCEMGPVKRTESGKATAMEAPGVTGMVDGICQKRQGKGKLMSCAVRSLRQAFPFSEIIFAICKCIWTPLGSSHPVQSIKGISFASLNRTSLFHLPVWPLDTRADMEASRVDRLKSTAIFVFRIFIS